MIRIAATGDVHFRAESAGTLRPALERLPEAADLLLIAGDLTWDGRVEQAEVLGAELDGVGVPVVAVLGNHDYHRDLQDEISEAVGAGGVVVLEGSSVVVDTPAGPIGVAGTKGFGGGFPDACGSEYGEPEMKAFMRYSRRLADGLEGALRSLDTRQRIALLHFSPVPETLAGERLEIFPFLGSQLLADACDRGGADLAIHGHAHTGSERGTTAGGVPVRNVAQPLIRAPYRLLAFDGRRVEDLPGPA